MDGIEKKSSFDLARWFFIASAIIAGLGLVGGGIFVYKKALGGRKANLGTTSPTLSPLPTPTVSEAPLASPTPELKRSDLKIKIFNGTGIPGAAGKAAQFLEKLGYEGIKTGNADSFDYKKSIIQIKENKKGYLVLLVQDFSQSYPLEKESKTLAEGENFDAIIILGGE